MGMGEIGYNLLAYFCSFCSEWWRREFGDAVDVMDDVSSSLSGIDDHIGDYVIDDVIVQIADGTCSNDCIVRETKTMTTIDSRNSHNTLQIILSYDNEIHTPALPIEKYSINTTSLLSLEEENVKKNGTIPSI